MDKESKPKKGTQTGSLSTIDPNKRPGASAVFEALKEAKKNGTYSKQTHKTSSTSFREGEPKPKNLSLVEKFAEKVGVVRGDLIFSKMIDCAIEGDMGAMTFVLERMYPKGKVPRTMYTALHDLITLGDIDAAQSHIIKETAAGNIDVDNADVLFQMTVKKSDMQVRQTTEEMKLLIEELKESKGVK